MSLQKGEVQAVGKYHAAAGDSWVPFTFPSPPSELPVSYLAPSQSTLGRDRVGMPETLRAGCAAAKGAGPHGCGREVPSEEIP